MGQRLVIQFKHKKKTYATLYQHWGGYTDESANTLNSLAGVLPLLIGKNLLETKFILQGQCEDFHYLPTGSKDANRNSGLLDFDKNNIGESISASEADIIIDTYTGIIDFQVYGIFEPEEYLEWQNDSLEEGEEKFTLDKLTSYDKDPYGVFSYTEADDIFQFVESVFELDDEVYNKADKLVLCKIR